MKKKKVSNARGNSGDITKVTAKQRFPFIQYGFDNFTF